jgi:hypothetical protein
MIRITVAGILAVVVSACAAESVNEAATGPLEEDAPIEVIREVAVAYEDDDEDILFHPTDVALAGDTLVVVDNGNDRLVFLDGELSVLGTVGREGAGPGEFASPVSVQVTPAEIIVAEINNGRFTVLDRSGAFVRTFGDIVPASSFAIDSKGAVYQAARSVTHHALKVTPEGESLFAARRDTAVGPEATAILKTARESWLAITTGDTLHVFNDTDGTLSKYSPEGTRLVTRELPAGILDTLKANRMKLVGALSRYGVTEWAGSLIKEFATTEANELLIGVAAGNTVALAVDPVTYRVRRIAVPEMTGSWVPLRDASGMAMRGDRLYVVSSNQLYMYELDRGGEGREGR